jgi:hypothetical protein
MAVVDQGEGGLEVGRAVVERRPLGVRAVDRERHGHPEHHRDQDDAGHHELRAPVGARRFQVCCGFRHPPNSFRHPAR